MNKRDQTLRTKVLERDRFICQKCKFEDKTGAKLEGHHITPIYLGGVDELNNMITLCFDCHHYAPDKKQDFEEYMREEADGTLTTFLKVWKKVIEENPKLIEEMNSKEKLDGKNFFGIVKEYNKIKAQNQKKGMQKKAVGGNVVSRAPYGYKIIDKKLVPSENSYLVQELFQEFLNTKTSLTQLAKKYSLSVNGLKKILTNQTYLGKVKFDGQIHQGEHQALISNTLFNHIQNKLKDILRA